MVLKLLGRWTCLHPTAQGLLCTVLCGAVLSIQCLLSVVRLSPPEPPESPRQLGVAFRGCPEKGKAGLPSLGRGQGTALSRRAGTPGRDLPTYHPQRSCNPGTFLPRALMPTWACEARAEGSSKHKTAAGKTWPGLCHASRGLGTRQRRRPAHPSETVRAPGARSGPCSALMSVQHRAVCVAGPVLPRRWAPSRREPGPGGRPPQAPPGVRKTLFLLWCWLSLPPHPRPPQHSDDTHPP